MILDTCALLWVAQGGNPLSEVALQHIDAAPVVYVSAISGFEIGIKVQKGKLHLPGSRSRLEELLTLSVIPWRAYQGITPRLVTAVLPRG